MRRPSVTFRPTTWPPFVKQGAWLRHEEALSHSLSKLKYSCKHDWHDGYEDQEIFMRDISDEISDWLLDMWAVLVAGEDFQLVKSCLICCTETVAAIYHCHSRTDFGDIGIDVCIESKTGGVLYTASDSRSSKPLAWFWRELLVTDAISKSDPASTTILADLEKYKIADDVFEWMPFDEKSSSEEFCVKHWTPAMLTASKELVVACQKKKVAKFIRKPSLALYHALASPTLIPLLIDAVRKDVAPGGQSRMPVTDAIEIFRRNGLLSDIVPLIPRVDDDITLLTLSKVFSGIGQSSEIRAAGLELLRNGLARAGDFVIRETHAAFPGIRAAASWLGEEFIIPASVKTFPQAERYYPHDADGGKVEKVVRDFVRQAMMDAQYVACGDRHDWEEPEDYPNFEHEIFSWLMVLGEWPDPQEASSVWNEVRWEGEPFGVAGLMTSLASRCGHDRPSLPRGIQTASKVFACKDLQELSPYLPRRMGSGGVSYPTIY